MLTRNRNAIGIRRETVEIPHSKIKAEIANILVKEGYVAKAEHVKTDEGYTNIKLWLKNPEARGNARVIQGLRRISKPGLRVYSGADELPKVLSGLGIAVISTSKGIMTDKEAREKNLGGEVLAFVW
jgi:small subunit ribosomal protein S8